MATLYVDKSGSDANAGTSWALAKLTIGGAVSIAASGDTILVGAGVYNEAVLLSKGATFSLTITANGYCVLDGTDSIADGFNCQVTANFAVTLTVNDFIVKDFTDAAFVCSQTATGTPTINANRCVAFDCAKGFHYNSVGNGGIRAANCIVHNCTNGYTHGSTGSAAPINMQRCVFAECGTAIQKTSQQNLTVKRCLITHSTTRHYNITNTAGTITLDWNDVWFDGSGGAIAKWSGTDYSTLATWQANSAKDASSVSMDPVYLDKPKKCYALHTSSPLFTMLREASSSSNDGISGAGPYYKPCVGFSKNDPDGHWANRILSATQVNGSDNIELASGSSGYARTPVIDLGRSRRLGRVNIKTSLDNALYGTSDVPDYDTADTQPKRLTFRYRTSESSFADGDGSPAWTEVEPNGLGADLLEIAARYVQVEVTLRDTASTIQLLAIWFEVDNTFLLSELIRQGVGYQPTQQRGPDILQSESTAARRRIPFHCVDAADGKTAETGVTLAAGDLKLSKNGAAEANHGGTWTEVSGGDYYYETTAGEVDTLGFLKLRLQKAGVRLVAMVCQVQTLSPYAALGTVWDELVASHAVAGSFGERLQYIRRGTCQVNVNQGEITLDGGASGSDDWYQNLLVWISSGPGAGQVRRMLTYNGSTKVGIIDRDWVTVPNGSSTFTLLPDSGQNVLAMLGQAFDPAAMGAGFQSVKVAAAGIAASSLDAQLDKYQMKVLLVDDDTGTTDRYIIAFFKNSEPILTGITSPTIQVVKISDATDLIPATALTQIGTTGLYKYEASAGQRIADGAGYVAKIQATIDSGTRKWSQPVGRDT